MRFKIFLSLLLLFFGGAPLLAYGQDGVLPKVLSRSVWFKGVASPLATTTVYKKPELIILHDLECEVLLDDGQRNPNCNSGTVNAASIIYNTYLFHRYVKKYDDIGYHFIIDRLGNIYRGRDGQNGIIGADAYDKEKCVNYDYGSISIALIGNYEKEAIPASQYEALKKLVGFLIYANNMSSVTSQMLWQDDKVASSCLGGGAFRYRYSGSSILKHSDLDRLHRDLESLDLKKFRVEVFEEAKRYSNYLFSIKGEGSVARKKLYEFSNGQLVEKTKIGNLVLELDSELASFFDVKTDLNINNSIVKIRHKPFYYFVKENSAYLVIPEMLSLEPYKDLKKIEVDEVKLAKYTLGESAPFPDGFLVRQKGDYKIYFSQNSTLRHISNNIILKEDKRFAGLNLIEIEPANFKLLKIGEPIYLPDGTIVKSADSFKIYYLEKGKKRHIVSYDVFKQYKFSSAKILVLPDDELRNIPTGKPLYHQDGSLLKTPDSDNIYYIEGGKKIKIENQSILTKLGLNNKNIRRVDVSELNFYENSGNIFSENDLREIREMLLNLEKRDKINPEIKVLLKSYEFSSAALEEVVRVKANGFFNLADGQNKKIESFTKDNTLTFRIGDILRGYNLPIVLQGDSDEVVMEVSFGGSLDVAQNIKLRGKILIDYNPYGNGSFLIINQLKIEDYLKGIAGFGDDDRDEFLKAAIIALRSYVLFKFYSSSLARKYYDINRSEEGLIYIGYDNEVSLPNLAKAVDSTNGYVIWYDGDIAFARLSLDTGGLSKDARQVLGSEYEKYPFLWGGVEDLPSTKHLTDYMKISHGVGLSLQGAREMALYSFKSEDILNKYYFNTEIKKIY